MFKKMYVFSIIIIITLNISAQVKVACIGNSITSGYSNTGFSYVPKLSELLGNGFIVQNFGVSGTTLLKKGDSPYWRTDNFKQVLLAKADIVTIKLGTNDTKIYNWDYHKDEFKKDYEALIDTLSTNGKRPLIFPVFPIPIFPTAVSVSWGMRDSIIVNHEIPVIKEIAAERGLTVIDAYTPLLPFNKYFAVDGVHPDKAAADTIAYVIYRGIRGATHSITSKTFIHDKNETLKVCPIVNGNLSNILSRVTHFNRCELSAFTLKGELAGKIRIDNSSKSQTEVKRLFAKSDGIMYLTFKKAD